MCRKETYVDNGVYEGEWKDNERSGHGKEIHTSGDEY